MTSLNSMVSLYAIMFSLLVAVISGYAFRPSKGDLETDGQIAPDVHLILDENDLTKFRDQYAQQLHDKQYHDLIFNNDFQQSPEADKRGRPMPPLPWDKRSMNMAIRGRAMPPLPWDKRETRPSLEQQIAYMDDAELIELQHALNARRMLSHTID